MFNVEIDDNERVVSFQSDNTDNTNNDNNINGLETESDEHLPRVRIELDRLNYANESINNLELEVEEAKRDFIRTIYESDEELIQLERKLGEHIKKSKPYYLARIELYDAKQIYLNSKIRFETAQELYVAAKNMQMYTEENLEAFDLKPLGEQTNRKHLVKMLDLAKSKVIETEISKQINDKEQIEAFRNYDEKLKKIELVEKSLKRNIEKSRKFFELKAKFNKELKFLYSKIEGLKSCLKEAKLAYQQSLKNLENISCEVHAQRSTMQRLSINNQKVNSPETSSSNISSSSVSSISWPKENDTNNIKTLTESTVSNDEDEKIIDEEEDFDKYFEPSIKEANNEYQMLDRLRKTGKSIQYSQKLAKHGISLLSDEEIESLRLDELLRNYEFELTNKKRTEDENFLMMFVETVKDLPMSQQTPNRPQFRVPTMIVQSKK